MTHRMVPDVHTTRRPEGTGVPNPRTARTRASCAARTRTARTHTRARHARAASCAARPAHHATRCATRLATATLRDAVRDSPPFFRDCSVFGQGRLSHLRFCRISCPKVLRSRKVGAGLPLPTATVAFSDKADSATCGFAGPLVRKCYVRAALIHNCSVFGHDTFH